MNRHEIEQAITKLSPDELARFRRWFEKFYAKTQDKQSQRNENVQLTTAQPATEEHLNKLKGSLKGKGLLKALMADKELEKKF